MSRTRRSVWIVVGLIALAALTRAGLALRDQKHWREVSPWNLAVGVEISGVLEAVDALELGPPGVEGLWNYRISFLAPEGAQVRAGQPVMGFDTDELRQRLVERTAARDSAQKEIEKRQTDLEAKRQETELQLAEARGRFRRAELKLSTPPSLVAEKELAGERIERDLARTEVAYLTERLSLMEHQAKIEIQGLQRERDAAARRVVVLEESIAKLRVPAPKAGIVIHLADWNGNKKKVGDNAWRGNTILQIPDLSRMKAVAELDEADLGKVAVGQVVSFRLDAHPDFAIQGKLVAIGRTVQPRSTFDPVRVVRLDIELDQADPERMRPGMRFRGKVETTHAAEVLAIPAAAVVPTATGPVVYTAGFFGGRRVTRCKLGRQSEGWVEVLEGLEAGDEVWVGDEGENAKEASP